MKYRILSHLQFTFRNQNIDWTTGRFGNIKMFCTPALICGGRRACYLFNKNIRYVGRCLSFCEQDTWPEAPSSPHICGNSALRVSAIVTFASSSVISKPYCGILLQCFPHMSLSSLPRDFALSILHRCIFPIRSMIISPYLPTLAGDSLKHFQTRIKMNFKSETTFVSTVTTGTSQLATILWKLRVVYVSTFLTSSILPVLVQCLVSKFMSGRTL